MSWPTRPPAEPGRRAARRGGRRQERVAPVPVRRVAAGASRGPSASSRRWSWPTAASTSSARRCSTISSGCPRPQRDALATVFGLSTGPPPDRFLVGLATLTLFAEVAEQQPLVCIVDDAQWLDQASAQILGFVARRLLAERIALVCAARTGIGDDVLAGLPELPIEGLGDSDARALLLDNVHGPLDAAVCEQIITESHGNPLALLELPRTWHVARSRGRVRPARQPPGGRQDRAELRAASRQLPPRHAAARPRGCRRAARRPGAAAPCGRDASAIDAGGGRPGGGRGAARRSARACEFAHPLVRSAAYGSAAADDRHRVHRALADATDAATRP